MKRFRWLIIGGLVLVLLLFIIDFYVFPTPDSFPADNYSTPILIAHAGGAIDGKTYTNSLEAVENASKNKYEFVELDLSQTTDGKIAAIHTFEDFNKFTGYEKDSGLIISSKDVENRKMFGYLHPLLSEDINILFENHTDIFLVTDKITDFDLMNEEIKVDRNRMLVEVFSYRKYREALLKGVKYPMLCIWDISTLDYYMKYIRMGKIKIITIPEWFVDSSHEKLKEVHDMGVAIFAFTSNDKELILRHGGKTVTGFYTDSVTYSNLYN